jgi:hypothetical protein
MSRDPYVFVAGSKNGAGMVCPCVTWSLMILSLLIVSLAGCGGTDNPFSYVKESGKITYTDGSLIPAPMITLMFVSETPSVGPTSPPLGIAEVNVADGTYNKVMSHTSEGVVRGKLKVLVRCWGKNERLLKVIGDEYLDRNLTPLEADTDNPASFNFTVKKYVAPPPGSQGRPGMQDGRRGRN